jgi:DNA-binding NarL/FixJ family response regulator
MSKLSTTVKTVDTSAEPKNLGSIAESPVVRALARKKGVELISPRTEPLETSLPMVRVLCVDDHAVLIEGLKSQFNIDRQLKCVASLDSAEGLNDAVVTHHPDVVLLDIDMPGPDVFQVVDRLHRSHPETRFVFLSAHIKNNFLTEAYRCGSSGYFAKGDDLAEIVDGIKRVARCQDGTFVTGLKVRARCQPPKNRGPRASGTLAMKSAQRTGAPPTLLDLLTRRELDVLRLIGKGLSRGEIANEFGRSPKTIDGHQERILKKLRITTRPELMRFAIREGLAEA